MENILHLLLCLVLLGISFIDLKTMIVDYRLFLCFVFITSLLLFYQSINLKNIFIGLMVPIVLFLINNYYYESFGQGDLDLFIVSGFLLGELNWLAFFIATMFGSIHGLYCILKDTKCSTIPFCPSLIIGILFTYFYHDKIVSVYYFYNQLYSL